LHAGIISLKEEVSVRQVITTPQLFIEVPARSQEIERSSICVLKASTSKLKRMERKVQERVQGQETKVQLIRTKILKLYNQ